MKTLALLALFASFSALAETVQVNVSGMVCSMCAQGIKKKFTKLGVKKIDVNLDTKVVTIETEKAGELTDKLVKETIEESGYAVANLKRF